MKIVLATNNRDKAKEIQTFFADLDQVLFVPLASWSEARNLNVALKEEGATLRDNALQKGRAAARAAGEWALADDAGLFVEALEGRPGIFSSRYAGEGATYKENVFKLLSELKNIPPEQRGAYFSCVMALVHPDGREVTVEGRLEGEIAAAPRGEAGFGYDPVFYLPDRNCTLAELTLEEKNRMSHRGRALVKMRGVIEGLLGRRF